MIKTCPCWKSQRLALLGKTCPLSPIFSMLRQLAGHHIRQLWLCWVFKMISIHSPVQWWFQFLNNLIGGTSHWTTLTLLSVKNGFYPSPVPSIGGSIRGKVMSHEANKLHMPYLTISIYCSCPISGKSINCIENPINSWRHWSLCPNAFSE